ncbi:phosphatase PAP2 family protein [Nocardia sp. NPDC052566]|uniref:phosphatase PAP2 family protein n=1 Tax=Nocardia sp. NPDC052566 TaxID=3364330 RepID=UPI0037CB7C9B
MIGLRQARISEGALRLGVAASAGAVTVALPTSFPADGGPTDVDRAVASPIHEALDAHPGVYEALVVPSNGYILLPLLVLAAVWFGRRGDWWRAATMLVVPELVVAINTWVLKPFWDRPLHDYLAYPSGHTVHLVAIATTFVLLTESARRRWIAVTLTVAILALVAVGMVGLGYHLPTDVVGGAGAAIALGIAFCAVSQWLSGHRRSRAAIP